MGKRLFLYETTLLVSVFIACFALGIKESIAQVDKRVISVQENHQQNLTLIPPSPVSENITLSIRGAVWNNTNNVDEIVASIYLDKEEDSALLHRQVLTVDAHSAKGVYFRWPTTDQAGNHQIIFVTNTGSKTNRTVKNIEIRKSKIRSLQQIDGAWSSLYHWSEREGKLWNEEIKKMTDKDWREVVRGMNEIGMNIIIVGEMFRNQMYVDKHSIPEDGYHGKAFYPSKLFPGRMPITTEDAMESILSEADERGMSVFIGVGLYAWFDFTKGSLEWHKKVVKELWDRYGHHPSFYGWYISEEMHGSLSPDDAETKTTKKHLEEIVYFFKEFRKYVRTLAPDKPIMLATNSYSLNRGMETYPKLLENLDILCPFGFHRMPKDDITGIEAAAILQDLCDKAGAHLWLEVEVFLFGKDEELYPRPVQGLVSDLKRFDNFEKIVCYQFPGLINAPWASRKPGGETTVKLYSDYKKYIDERDQARNSSEVINNSPSHEITQQFIETSVDSLLTQMSLQEKIDLVGGKGFNTKANIRLNIPQMLMTNGPLGPNSISPSTN